MGTLTSDEIKTLMATCSGDDQESRRDRAALGLLLGAGLRRGELAGLRWEHIARQEIAGRERVIIAVQGKAHRARSVAISDKLAGILDRWGETAGREGYVVRSLGKAERLGESISGVGLLYLVRRRGKQIGMENLEPNDLRQTFAHFALDCGFSLVQVAAALGERIGTAKRLLDLEAGPGEAVISDCVPL